MQSNNSSENCIDPPMDFQSPLYAVTNIIIFIPGLLANGVALWVLCRFISKKSKAVVYMINLAVADLVHVFSLPFRMYYYLNQKWPFGDFLCKLCFYLKYHNMYASILFLTCISIQRYLFLLYPFKAKDWKRRYDIAISATIWVVVGAACLSLLVLRRPDLSNNSTTCFADLEVKQLTVATSVSLAIITELSGFVVPLAVIIYCTWKMRQSLQEVHAPLQHSREKPKALRMIVSCAIVFFVCFTPYHVNFPFFMMVKQKVITNCAIRYRALHFHPISLCLASLNCCLDPILYYFMTSEFKERLCRCRRANVLSCPTSQDSSSIIATTVSAGEKSEDGETNPSCSAAYFWTLQPHKFEINETESALSC